MSGLSFTPVCVLTEGVVPAVGENQCVLVVDAAADREGLRPELSTFNVRFVSTDEGAHRLILNESIALVIAAPSVSPSRVDALLERVRASRPGLLVLIILKRQSSQRNTWASRDVGILRCPLVPGALSRSVALLLSLREGARH